MAYTLQFDKIGPVRFGDIEAAPRLTQERRLRLSSLTVNPSAREEAAAVLAECFDDKAEEIKAFMLTNMSELDLARLQAYLIGGSSNLAQVDEKMDRLVHKQVDDAYEKLKAKKVAVDE